MANPLDSLKNLSKPQKYAVIGGSILLLGVFEYKHHASSGSWNPFSKSAGTATGTGLDPVTGLPVSQDNAIDPLTNLPYLAEAEQYGSVAAAEAAVSNFGQTVNSGTGTAPGGSPGTGQQGGPGNPQSGSPYTSNAAWAQAATAGLADVGYPQTAVASALGDYLTSTPVDATQAQYIRTAIAEFGDPPVGSFQIILAPVTKPGATQATVPYVTGMDLVEAQRDISDAGLKSTFTGPQFTAGNGTRIVESQKPTGNTKVTQGSNVTLVYKVTGAYVGTTKPPIVIKGNAP